VEKHLKNGCLRQLQALFGVLPQLICWMELI
jgi:hypothetical protein